MELINYTEIMVKEQLEEVTMSSEVCRCEQCKLDIMAIALNNLPPRYVVTEKGRIFSKVQAFNVQMSVDVVGAITDAVNKVKGKPNH